MRVIRDIGLQLDIEDELKEAYQSGNEKELEILRKYASDFAFHCRFIGNFLRRTVKPIKFEPMGYNRIVINACKFSIKPNTLFENTLVISILFDKQYFDSLSVTEVKEYFIKLYESGIVKASKTHNLPVDFLLAKLTEFKENNYLNEWEFKSKLFKEIGIKATLLCKMTMECFSLRLLLKKGSEIVFSEEILKTLPDEIIYHWQFKEIALEDNEIKVLDEFNNPIYSLDLTFKA